MHTFYFLFFIFAVFLVWDGTLERGEIFKLCQKNSSDSLGTGTNFLNLYISLPLFDAKEEKTEP